MSSLRPLVAAFAFLGLAPGCLWVDVPSRSVDLEFRTGLQHIDVETLAGDVVVVGAQVDRIYVHARMRGSGTFVEDFEAQDGLYLRTQCGEHRHHCSIDYTITVPENFAVRIDTAAGDLEVEHIGGDLSLSSDAGDIAIQNVWSQNADIHSSAGDVHGHWQLAPRQLSIDTSAGDVELRVPADVTYAISAITDAGDVRVRGLTTASNAEHRIDCQSSAGDVHISAG